MAATGVPASLTTYQNFLKERHVFETLIKQFVSKHPILKRFTSRPMVQLNARNARWNVVTRDAQSFGAVSEFGQPPPADAPGADEGIIPIATLMATIQISWQLLEMAKSKQATFVTALSNLTTSCVAGFMQNMQRVLMAGWGDGALAQVVAITANTPTAGIFRIEVEPEMDAERLSALRFMLTGLRLSGSATRTGTLVERNADLRVTGRDVPNNFLYADGDPGTLAAGDFLYWWNSKNQMPVGITAACDDGTQGPSTIYNGIARTTVGHEWAKGYVRAALGGGDKEEAIQVATDTIANENGREPDVCYVSLEVWRSFARDLKAGRQYTIMPNTDGRYVAGVSTIAYTGAGGKDLAINRDRDVLGKAMFLLDMSTWHLGEVKSPGWVQMDGEGSPWHRMDKAVGWEAQFGWMGQGVCEAPGGNGMILDVAV